MISNQLRTNLPRASMAVSVLNSSIESNTSQGEEYTKGYCGDSSSGAENRLLYPST